MQPLLAVLDETLNKDSFFLDLLAEETGCSKDDILDYQFYIYNCDTPCRLGIHGEMLSSPRLDNLTSVHACLSGIMNSRREHGISAAVLYDNEEIGSSTKQGAASPLMERVLEKLYLSLGYGRSSFLDALFGGFLLSLDVAHALHPNQAEKYDPKDRISLNEALPLSWPYPRPMPQMHPTSVSSKSCAAKISFHTGNFPTAPISEEVPLWEASPPV